MTCPFDSIRDLSSIHLEEKSIETRAYYIWKKYGNSNSDANYYQAIKELKMIICLDDVFTLFNNGSNKCSFDNMILFGRFLGVDWSLIYLQETFDNYTGDYSSLITYQQYIDFCIDELNGMNILSS